MRSRSIQPDDHPRVAEWNRQLQIDEGATPMEREPIEARLRRWLGGVYDGVIFEVDGDPIGYALYRPTDDDQKEPGGIYLRQFFIAAAYRRRGNGTRAMRAFLDEVVAGRRLVLEALNSNPAGQEFWRSLGMSVYAITFELRETAAD